MSSAVLVLPPCVKRASITPSVVFKPSPVPPIDVSEACHDDAAAWDGCVAKHRDATLFHNFAWRRAVEDVYGHDPYYLAARRRGRIVGVLPMFRMGGPLIGRTLVSVPYGVGGGILADDDQARRALYQAGVALADRLDCRSIQFRSLRPNLPGVPQDNRHYTFRRMLPASAADLADWLPRKARASARNARRKYKLTVHYGDDHLRAVWKLYALNMRRLASLAYPLRFFERLLVHHSGRHLVSLVSRHDKPVAGLVTFTFRDTVYPYFYGANREARQCGAAHFVYSSLMEWAVRAGYRTFDFGRTRRDNIGSIEFKRLCGFTPRPLGYQTYAAPGRPPSDLTPGNPRIRLARYLWPRLPLCVTNPLGAALSKCVPG